MSRTFIWLSFLIFILSTPLISSGQDKNTSDKIEMILNIVNQYHYNPKEIDDNFSSLLYDNWIESMDGGLQLFAKEDISKLEEHKYLIDDYINNKEYSFLKVFSGVYNEKIRYKIDFLNNSLNKTIDWNKKDSIYLSDKTKYVLQSQLEATWDKTIRYRTLTYFFDKIDTIYIDNKSNRDSINNIRTEVLKREVCALESILSKNNYTEDLFIRSLTSTFDPHTVYFSAIDNEFFNASLSKESLSFGLDIELNDFGEIEISKLIPGSPAWRSNEINENDVLIAIQPLGQNKIEIGCNKAYDIIKSIYSSEVTNAVFTIRKKSGSLINVNLTKDAVTTDDNIIQSYLLNGKNKIAYIYLPSFYTNMSYYYSDGCANDIAKEIIKLKREEIEGLILDLRNNGGGAMLEAINLAGMFINYGALGVADFKDEKPSTYKDMNRGVIFDKPLVILQNQFSASASEFFSAALQDYNRAIIVGCKSFGKSTIQQVLPLVNEENSSENTSNNGFMKLTIGKFYRINGSTHQKQGVIPDITLPSIYDKNVIGEAKYPTALNNDSLVKKVYAYPLNPLPIETLRNQSQNRIESNKYFKMIAKQADKNQDDYSKISLEINSYSQYYESNYNTINTSDSLSLYEINIPQYAKEFREISPLYNDLDNITKNKINEDSYIKESYSIITDLIEIQKLKK